MTAVHLTPEQIDALSAQIDQQLATLSATGSITGRRGAEGSDLEAQRRAIETTSGEAADSFLQRFRRAVYHDMCEEGGQLNRQWEKWANLNNPEVIRTFGGVLAGMGITGHLIPALIVPLAVIVINLGIKAFCAGCPTSSTGPKRNVRGDTSPDS